jgi:hypothetical protein
LVKCDRIIENQTVGNLCAGHVAAAPIGEGAPAGVEAFIQEPLAERGEMGSD